MSLLEGKKILVLGVANNRSLAYGVARELRNAGARIALTYVNDAIQSRVEPLAEELGADFTAPMDVCNEEHFQTLFETVKEKWGEFDGMVHSLAFANKEALKGAFVDISKEDFAQAMEISAFSLIKLTKSLKELMPAGSSILTMTYEGSTKIVKGYNMMGVAKAALESIVRYLAEELGKDGIRVNSISSGPIKTLAASGVGGLSGLIKLTEAASPLRRSVNISDIGKSALYLMSDLASGVTAQNIFVDGGASVTLLENGK